MKMIVDSGSDLTLSQIEEKDFTSYLSELSLMIKIKLINMKSQTKKY